MSRLLGPLHTLLARAAEGFHDDRHMSRSLVGSVRGWEGIRPGAAVQGLPTFHLPPMGWRADQQMHLMG